MPKTIAYARVSTDKQESENQHFEIERYCATRGLTIDEYINETISGTKRVSERKLGTLIDTLVAGDTLIISETSRISRRLNEIFAVVQQLIDKEVTLIAVKQNYVFGNDIQSKVIAFAFGLASEIERDLISSRTRATLARLKAEGKILGRPKGTGDITQRKLYGKDEDILFYMDKQVPKAAMSRLLEVNIKTLQTYIVERGLESTWRTRKLEEYVNQHGHLTNSDFEARIHKVRG